MMNDEYDPQQDSGMGPEQQPEGKDEAFMTASV